MADDPIDPRLSLEDLFRRILQDRPLSIEELTDDAEYWTITQVEMGEAWNVAENKRAPALVLHAETADKSKKDKRVYVLPSDPQDVANWVIDQLFVWRDMYDTEHLNRAMEQARARLEGKEPP